MQWDRLSSMWLDHNVTVPPVTAGGSDANTNNRLYTDECLKNAEAQIISHFHGQVVQTALSVPCLKDKRI